MDVVVYDVDVVVVAAAAAAAEAARLEEEKNAEEGEQEEEEELDEYGEPIKKVPGLKELLRCRCR